MLLLIEYSQHFEITVLPLYLSWRESWIRNKFRGSVYLELGLRTGAWSLSLAISNTSTTARLRYLEEWKQVYAQKYQFLWKSRSVFCLSLACSARQCQGSTMVKAISSRSPSFLAHFHDWVIQLHVVCLTVISCCISTYTNTNMSGSLCSCVQSGTLTHYDQMRDEMEVISDCWFDF